MSSMESNLEIRLNRVIEEKGFQISPGVNLEERLARYVEINTNAKGNSITNTEANIVAIAIIMISQTGEDPAMWNIPTDLPIRDKFMELFHTIKDTYNDINLTFNNEDNMT